RAVGRARLNHLATAPVPVRAGAFPFTTKARSTMDGNGYDERLFRLMLAEFVRRNFTEAERAKLPDVRVCICSPLDWNDPESDRYENRNIIVIPGNPLPRPHGSGL